MVKLDSWGGANGGTKYGTVKNSSAHLLFILTADKEMYVIPVSDINTDTTLTLNSSCTKYRVWL